ncbi:DM13 domain-containing protein [Solwaraspora sp. WMMD1047]|uniref:DM13 domain-containing protein n=1 Tax=Solwaraspora sp. WMMD1047 TaxID=3016102 RepID=UPI00241759E5|nr:DM13 domain-containing protein [Solwaraspora sp. WMMD1047]MDG4828313.1 DM13 domain-containing protein [Solwaraspora sp. WMMD1047]
MWTRALRSPLTWTFVVALGIAGAFGMYWFQPWKLVTDQTVTEALPTIETPPATAPQADPSASGPPAAGGPATSAAPPAGNTLLAKGEFITHEHKTTGTAQLIRRPDGRHQLVLRDLATSNGPDLRVWLTDQPVLEGTAGWRVFDDGEWVELDRLKGNRGDQVYDLPSSVDPADFSSVSIWCKRFSVSFGAAELTAA